ncbi:MAG: hypothetical protein K8R02_01185 [Anaerohalosphaeraceae bacterium]|nr:hypothetical protein [Anaerohalosphaeraceae bacterium]
MKKIDKSTFTIFVLLVLTVLSINVYAISGSGTESDPYLIQSLSDFNDFVADANYWDDYTRLETDVNLAGITYTNAPVSPDASSQFSGNFDGNGYGIVNLTINTGHLLNHYLGLFGYIDSVGVVKNLTVADCNIIGRCDSDFIGALAGFNYGTIEECCATGSLSGDDRIGGLVGNNNNGNINNCYAQISIIGDDSKIGGLVGYSYNGNISYCYSTGAVSGSADVGGLIGSGNSDTITACFWDVQTSGTFTSAGGTGKTTSEMQEESTFTDAGWDFLGETVNGTSYIWTIESGNVDYPRHSLTGTGSETDPFLIRTLADFNDFSSDDLYWASGLYTRLETDIDLAGTTYTTAVISPDISTDGGFQGTEFTGSFDGDYHKISNLTIDTAGANTDYLGLFGYTDNDAVIKNLGIENCSITGGIDSDVIGGLLGRNYGYITECYATGTLTGDRCIGGLVGMNSGWSEGNRGTISYCYATASVSTDANCIGGLVGSNSNFSITTNCYATGSVAGDNCLGGLCGCNYLEAEIVKCYSTGAVSGDSDVGGLVGRSYYGATVSNSFWDKETSGCLYYSAGGTGKTTAEMKTASTFLDAGWDFVDVWDMEEIQTYPFLRIYLDADLNRDRKVDMLDFAAFADYWLEGVE